MGGCDRCAIELQPASTTMDDMLTRLHDNPRLLVAVMLTLSLAWAGVIILTDQVAWSLAGWWVTTLGPYLYLSRDRTDIELDR